MNHRYQAVPLMLAAALALAAQEWQPIDEAKMRVYEGEIPQPAPPALYPPPRALPPPPALQEATPARNATARGYIFLAGGEAGKAAECANEAIAADGAYADAYILRARPPCSGRIRRSPRRLRPRPRA